MKAHFINTHLLVTRSRSSAKVKVKYQGHVSQKMGVSWALVFHKCILFHNVFVKGSFLWSSERQCVCGPQKISLSKAVCLWSPNYFSLDQLKTSNFLKSKCPKFFIVWIPILANILTED